VTSKDRAARRLPRGRHGLPRELVAESQRLRLLAAAGEVLAARGVKAVTSRQIANRAGVSSSTFYVYFKDVDACLVAAHAMAADALWELISAACAGAAEWPERVRAAVDAAGEFLGSEPGLARLLCVDLAVAVPAVAEERRRLLERLADLLSSGRPRPVATAGELLPDAEIHLTTAAADLIGDRITAGDIETLPPLSPELTEILITAL
jgi:AcrR family transcriptional regulator